MTVQGTRVSSVKTIRKIVPTNDVKILMIVLAMLWLQVSASVWAQEKNYPPIVPQEELAEARSMRNPLPVSQEFIDEGKKLYEGRMYCAACHGKDGRGFGRNIDPRSVDYPLPRDFTNAAWQEARTDGELFWVLMNGSHGTDMAPVYPLHLSGIQSWQVVAYIRTFWEKERKL